MTKKQRAIGCEPVSAEPLESRRSVRTLTVLRTVKVQTADGEGLARLHNISDEGMKLALRLRLCPGDPVTIHLSDKDSLEGTIVWTNGRHCGLKFAARVDSAAVLATLAERSRAGRIRAVRMASDSSAVASSEQGVQPVRVTDVSQDGMKVRNNGGFAVGLPVRIRTSHGLETKGVVRWSEGDLAGLKLSDPIDVEVLGRSKDFGA